MGKQLSAALQRVPDLGSAFASGVIGRLVADPDEFNLKMFRKAGGSAEHTTLFREKIIKWREGNEPTQVQVAAEVRMKLDEVWKRFDSLPDALRPIFDEWKKSQS